MLLDVNKKSNILRRWRWRIPRLIAGYCGVFLVATCTAISAQAPIANQPAGPVPAQGIQPVAITLDEAIRRAQASNSNYVSAEAGNRISRLDRSIARNSLLPSAVYLNQYLYTQGNGIPTTGSSAE